MNPQSVRSLSPAPAERLPVRLGASFTAFLMLLVLAAALVLILVGKLMIGVVSAVIAYLRP
jgi:hypothetical protein